MRRSTCRLACAALLALGPGVGHAQAPAPGLSLRTEPDLLRIPADRRDPLPLFIEADRLYGQGREEIEAEGNAVLRRRGQALFADRIRHTASDGDVTAEGSVVLVHRLNEVRGPYLFLNIVRETGFMEWPDYFLPEFGGRGSARRMFIEAEDRLRVERAEYTTCGPGVDDWYIRADELLIDQSRNSGLARGATLEFLGVPIFYTPVLSFPLSAERKSGFLAPTLSISGRNGPEVFTPYYWAIAPNRDYTATPRLITRRGVQLGNEFRYLEPDYRGELRAEYLPSDRVTQDNRYLLAARHLHSFGTDALGGRWTGVVDMQKVSDDFYFRDLSTRIALTSQANLLRDATLARLSESGTLIARMQRFQTLQDPLAPVTPPYARLPQVALNSSRLDVNGFDLGMAAEYVNFSHPTLPRGQRTVFNPSITLPLQNEYGFVRPRIALHATHYAMDPQSSSLPTSTRVLPIMSVDSGVVFERDTRMFSRDLVQTLEPRLFYAYIPYRDQSKLPVFDSALPDPSLVTLFQENLYSGSDRIADANQITAGAVSRLIDPANGHERLRLALAQRFYMQDLQVSLPGTNGRDRSKSDLLAAVSARLVPAWSVEAGAQYSTSQSQFARQALGVRYMPEPGRLVNAAYRYNRGQLEQLDFSGQWRFSDRWSTLGRYNFSLSDRSILEALAGFQYDEACWSFRFIASRIAVATQQANTTLFFQIELRGLSRVGSNPLELLRRSIPGYTETEVNRLQPPDELPYPMR
ncbi:MAG: LPS-assembly protein LptD [Pseudomonadota bacterium]|jgi:LPS-assembly protein